jgi:uncharacterized membrane protein YhhN
MTDFAGWGLILFSAILDWLAVGFGWNKAKYLTKPFVMILLISWMTIQGGWHVPVLWFTLGAVFSLIGDVCLMLPGNYFLAGLVSFLLAHLLYVTGLFSGSLYLSPILILTWVIVITIAVITTRKIRQGVHRKTGARRLRWAVTIYSVAVTAMFLSALSTIQRPGWGFSEYLAVALGGMLFYLSDTLLAYDRFVSNIRHGRLIVRITYHLGQILLLGGVLAHFSV